ncbi:ABC transporter substrate-binding protein [Rhizohabitans arisaemae]|uniref:ABC transporter substrate-binding protein n=1 Tax=Rhizohabitans arisaemae TaxID=2720610 RepID=UPI0024B22E74|nr:ABC transporter substrate-binding protein [Rhizohabitans arisaemae]
MPVDLGLHAPHPRPSHRPRLRGILGVAVTLALTATACGTGGSAGKTSGPGDAGVVARLNSDWDSLDPAKTRTTNGYQLVTALYDRLVAVDGDKVVPYLAESWKQTPDTVTLTLRTGVTCANGTALTPSNVAESLRRLGAKETAAPYANLVFGNAGYTVDADDAARTVTVKTNKPYSDLLIGLAQPMASIVCPEGLADPEKLAATPAGSGPYTLGATTRGASYTLKARQGYAWGPAGASGKYPAELTFRVVQNDGTAANLLAAGDLDLAWVAGPDLPRVQADKSLTPVTQAIYGSFFLAFNQAKGRPGADPGLRKALAGAVGAADFNQAAFFGAGDVAASPVSPEVPCYTKVREPVTTADPAGVTRALGEAGWNTENGKPAKDGKPLTLKVLGSTDYAAGFEYVLEALRKTGATVDLRLVELNAFAETLFKGGDWDVTVYPFTPLAPSLGALGLFVTGDAPPKGANFAGIANPAFEAAVAKAQASLGEERCAHWATAQRAVVETADVTPLVHLKPHWFARSGVTAGLAGGGTMADVHRLVRS